MAGVRAAAGARGRPPPGGPGVSRERRSLAVDVGGLRLATPVLVASGCAGTGRELGALVDLRRVGGVVTRTITVEPRQGSAPPRIAESASGVVWATGNQNPGIEAFLASELPAWTGAGVPVLVSIAGGTLEENVRLSGSLQGHEAVAGIEVALWGSDTELDRPVLGAHAERVTEIVGAVARMSLVPVFAKLPGAVDVVPIALAAARAGATGLTVSASPPAMAIDGAAGAPALGATGGWLSGPALKPMTLRAVADVARALPRMPILASGGIRSGADAVEALLAGAAAVQVGVAALQDPEAPVEIARGIVDALQARGLASPAQLRAAASPAPAETPA
jgi:dihydroorotate dehydrogenase (NAD+) catalytic subunit